MKTSAAVLAAALALLPSVLCAQDTLVHADQRIRFVAPGAGYVTPVTGTVVEVRGEDLHLTLAEPEGMLVVVPVSSITRLERSEGRRSRVRYGAYGLAQGTALGAVAGEGHSRLRSRWAGFPDPDSLDTYATEFTLAGALIGAMVGALRPGEQWRSVGPASLSVASSVSAGGAPALSLRIEF